MIETNSIANTLGILSLLSSFVVVKPTFSSFFNKNAHSKKIFLYSSYLSLLLTICLGLIHGLLMTQITNIDFYSLSTYWMYIGGLFVFNLLIFMAIAFQDLKQNLQKLNYFNYAVLVLLVLHLGQKIMP